MEATFNFTTLVMKLCVSYRIEMTKKLRGQIDEFTSIVDEHSQRKLELHVMLGSWKNEWFFIRESWWVNCGWHRYNSKSQKISEKSL